MHLFGFTIIRTEKLTALEADAILAGLPDRAEVLNELRLTRLEQRLATLERAAQQPSRQQRQENRNGRRQR